ncbi:flagellin [Arcobacter arenosus]|uniref:flagellin n=1 Tax=Arcobacter arenosus TaxID=2576037 RepID=UPI003BA994C4
MDINSINNNLTSSLNNVPNQQIGASNKTESVSKSEDSFSLSINEYNKKRDELSASLQTFNEGIGIAITAQSGIEKQKETLEKISEKLSFREEDLQNNVDKNQVKNEINQELLNFREIAFETTYKRENLLYVDQYDETTSIDISTKEAYFSMDKPNTPEVAIAVGNAISKNDLNNQEQLNETIEIVKESIKALDDVHSQFQDLRINLVESARESIQEQKDLTNQNRITKQYDFPKEVTDFTKSNVIANAGYLAASQANIVQEQSVKLVGVR